jgi:hypothetical protein
MTRKTISRPRIRTPPLNAVGVGIASTTGLPEAALATASAPVRRDETESTPDAGNTTVEPAVESAVELNVELTVALAVESAVESVIEPAVKPAYPDRTAADFALDRSTEIPRATTRTAMVFKKR